MARPTKKTAGKYDRKSPRIGFHEWNLEAIEDGAIQLLNKAFKEALDIATAEYEVVADFKIKKGNLMLAVELPIGPEEYANPVWEFPMAELVADTIEISEDRDDIPYLTELRDQLRKEADRLDAAISTLGTRSDETVSPAAE